MFFKNFLKKFFKFFREKKFAKNVKKTGSSLRVFFHIFFHFFCIFHELNCKKMQKNAKKWHFLSFFRVFSKTCTAHTPPCFLL